MSNSDFMDMLFDDLKHKAADPSMPRTNDPRRQYRGAIGSDTSIWAATTSTGDGKQEPVFNDAQAEIDSIVKASNERVKAAFGIQPGGSMRIDVRKRILHFGFFGFDFEIYWTP